MHEKEKQENKREKQEGSRRRETGEQSPLLGAPGALSPVLTLCTG